MNTFAITTLTKGHSQNSNIQNTREKPTFIFRKVMILLICIISSFRSSFLAPSLHLCTTYDKIEIYLLNFYPENIDSESGPFLTI